ncbi:uncharacterized protein LOC129776490 [Toxorhynchites rutilus septentrionalis]|uniref:uncharacterized protein LOC129776490 n=1 Tax=Toxorhynchites rutilus septentrionalis TaxID=329112 RepID=UPI00247AD66E|nr:uncharacterized protein LOC129776490 [Toxorhynchites rutilus septentrionalis]
MRGHSKHYDIYDRVMALSIQIFFFINFIKQVRTLTVLKKKYENIKKNIRQAVSKETLSRRATGGGRGPEEWRPKSEAMAELREVIALSVDGLQSLCDDDDDEETVAAAPKESTTLIEPEIDSQIEPHAEVEAATSDGYEVEYLDDDSRSAINNEVACDKVIESDHIEGSTGDDRDQLASPSKSTSSVPKSGDTWDKYSPAMLKRPKSNLLQAKSKRQKTIEQDLKKKILERNEEMMEEVHRLDVQKRRTDLESAHINLQTDKIKLQMEQLRYQHMREEHALRIKLLNNSIGNNTETTTNSSGSISD